MIMLHANLAAVLVLKILRSQVETGIARRRSRLFDRGESYGMFYRRNINTAVLIYIVAKIPCVLTLIPPFPTHPSPSNLATSEALLYHPRVYNLLFDNYPARLAPQSTQSKADLLDLLHP